MRVIVAEDDNSTRLHVSSALKMAGFDVLEAWTVDGVRRLMSSVDVEAVLLDLELEDGVSFELINAYESRDTNWLVVSHRSEMDDKLKSFELGARDYVTKPFDVREVIYRLKRLVEPRTAKVSASAEVLLVPDLDLKLDLIERQLIHKGKVIAHLSPMEFSLLQLMREKRNALVTRDEILKKLMKRRVLGNSRAVDVLVSKLRKKLKVDGQYHPILSTRGEGYMFVG